MGIDPQSRNHILESILRLRDEGTTVIYTTHYMEEVEAISSRIIILDHGAIIAEGTKESLKESVANERHCLVEVDVSETTDGEDAVRALDALRLVRENLFSVDGVKSVRIDGTTIDVISVAGIENVDGIVLAIVGQGLPIKNMTSVPVSLETVFLQLTGRKLRD